MLLKMRFYSNILPRLYTHKLWPKKNFGLQKVTYGSCRVHRCVEPFLNPKPLGVAVIPKATVFSGASKEPPVYDPDRGHLVYVGPLTKFVKYVKVISVSTSVFGIMVQPFIYESFLALPGILQALVGGSLGIFIFLNPVLFHWVTKRYITTLYYESESEVFSADTLNFFVMKKTRKFRAADVQVPDIAGLFTTFKVDGVPLLLDPTMFLQPEIYKKLMGYDKPLDLSDFINDKDKEKE